jgi:hypothetical protein
MTMQVYVNGHEWLAPAVVCKPLRRTPGSVSMMTTALMTDLQRVAVERL